MARRRWWVLGLAGLGGVAAVALIGTVGFGAWLTTDSGETFLEKQIEKALNSDSMTTSIGDIRTDLWTGAEVDDFHLAMEGLEVKMARLDAEIDRAALLRGELRFKAATAEGVLVVVQMVDPDPNDPPAEPFSGLGIDLEIADIDLRGANVSYRLSDGTEVVRVVGGSGHARFVAKGDTLRVEELDINALLGLTGATAAHVKGAVGINPQGTFLEGLDVRLPHSQLEVDGSVTDELAIDIRAGKLSMADADQLIGNPGLAGDFTGAARVEGPTDQIRWKTDLDGLGATAGHLDASGTVDTREAKLGWTVDAELDTLDVNQLYPGLGSKTELTGRAVVDGSGTSWPDELAMTVTWDGEAHDAFGQKVDAAHAVVKIANGKVRLEQTRLDGIIGQLEIDGIVDTVGGPMDLHIRGSIVPARLRALGVSGIDSSGWLDARVQGDLTNDKAPIRVNGTATFAPFRSGDSISFERVSARYALTVLGEDIRGTASVEALVGDIGGIGIARAEVPELRFSQSPGGLKVSGGLRAQTVSMPQTFATKTLYGTWTLDDRGATADLVLDGPSILEIPGTGGRISVRQAGDSVDMALTIDGGATPILDLSGQFDTARSALKLDTLTFAPTPRATWVATKPLRLTLSDGGVTDAEIALSSEVGTVRFTGAAGTKGPLDGSLAIDGLKLDALGDLEALALTGLDGSLDLALTLTGTADAPLIDGSISAAGISWPDQVRQLDITGTFGANPHTATTLLDFGVAGTPLARLGGTIPVRLDLADPKLDPDGPIDLRFTLRPGSLDRIALVSPAAEELPKGALSAVLELHGTLADPDVRLAGILEAEVPDWTDPARVEFELTRNQGNLGGWSDVRYHYKTMAQAFTFGTVRLDEALRPLIVDGAMPEGMGPSQLIDDLLVSGVVLEFPASMITAAAGMEDAWVRGVITGGFQLSGEPTQPQIDASMNWVDGKLGRQGVEAMDLRVSATDTGFDVDLDMDFRKDGRLEVTGPIPMKVDFTKDPSEWPTGPMNLAIGGPGIPLRAATAFDQSITKVDGVVQILGRVGGTVFAPEPIFTVGLTGGAATVDAIGLRVENLVVDLAGDTKTITLHEISGTTKPARGRFDLQEGLDQVGRAVEEGVDPDAAQRPVSSFKGGGEITLVDGSLTDVRGRMRLDNGTWVINTPETRVQLDGKLKVAGTWPELIVGGNLILKDGLVKLDAATFVDRAPLDLDPRIAVVRNGGIRVASDDDAPPWYQDMTAGVAFDLRRALQLDVSMPFVDDFGSLGAFVSRADLFARLGGQAQLTLVNGEPSMVGELELNEGRLKMMGRRFDVEDGTIIFTGGDIAEPVLDIRAETTVSNIAVAANVAGTPSSPEITTECDGYPSQSDCLTILITGRAPDSDEGGPGAGAALAGMALGGLLGQQDVADLSIEPDGTLQVGAAVTNSIYFTYTLNPSSEIGENQNTGEFDIGLARRLVLNLAIGDTKSWTDIFWEMRF